MEKGNRIQKRKIGEEKQNIPCARKCRTTGPAVVSAMVMAETTERTSRTQMRKAERREVRLQASGPIG
jgi:hypothetical protein